MRRVPPVLTLLLVAFWLLLNNSISIAQVLLGSIVAVALMLAAAQLRPLHPRLRRLWLIVPLTFTVLIDIVRSNIDVGRIILGLTRASSVHSGFVDIPLELRDPHALAILAAIVTATPGTAWAGMSEDGTTLTIHVLDVQDDQQCVRTIKERYERPLMRIFE